MSHSSKFVPSQTLTAAALVALLAGGACSPTVDPSPDGGRSDAGADVGDASAPATGAELNGTWRTPCYMSARTTLAYNNLQLTGTYTEYSDATCTTERHVARWTGRATVGAEVSPGVRRLDLAFDSFRSTALTAPEAAYVNMGRYCGITDWAAGVERDILGLECYGFAIPRDGRSLDIYRVDGATLLLGRGSVITVAPTEAARPTEIDPTRPFTRVP